MMRIYRPSEGKFLEERINIWICYECLLLRVKEISKVVNDNICRLPGHYFEENNYDINVLINMKSDTFKILRNAEMLILNHGCSLQRIKDNQSELTYYDDLIHRELIKLQEMKRLSKKKQDEKRKVEQTATDIITRRVVTAGILIGLSLFILLLIG